jgi:predicted acylesterase/phospholipase RssA
LYDTSALRSTLESLVDFDRINARQMRFSVGAVNVRSGNFVYFDSTTHVIRPEHVMASGALPPGFAAVEIDGECYWDGGLISNTPLQWVLDSTPRQDTLAFQVDLWSARGDFPGNEFSRSSMETHWRAGYHDTVRTLRHPEVLKRPANHEGVAVFDLEQDGRD